MADKRISQLNAVTTPTGSDLLVIVNNNETKKITYANLVASLTGSETDLTLLNQFTQSIDGRVDSLESWSSSLDSTFATDLQVSIVSSSVAATIGVISQNTGLLSTASFNQYTASISTGSLVDRLDLIESVTSSYETKGSGILSGSVSYLDLTNIPSNIVSQSTDLSSLNAFTASYFTDSASVDSRLDGLENWSSSLTDTFATDLEVQIVSSSVAATIGVISQNTGLVSTASFNSFTQSIDGRVDSLENATSSFATTGSNEFTGSQNISGSIVVDGTINASSISTPTISIGGGYIVSDGNDVSIGTDALLGYKILTNANTHTFHFDLDGNLSVPGNIIGAANFNTLLNKPSLISGSSQLTSSFDERYTLSGSVQNIELPENLVSSSAQITAFGFISSSQTIDTGSLATTGSNTFIGTETISGSLLLSGSFSYNGTPLQNGFAFAQPILTKILDNVSYTSGTAWRASYTSNGGAIIVTANMSGFRSGTGSGTAQLLRDGVAVASHTFYFNIANYHTPITPLVYVSNSETGSHTYEIFYNNILADTQDYATINVLEYGNSAILPATLISGSSQLTSSFDARYTLSGSVSAVPSGTISGSSQLTSSFDTRYLNAGGDGVWSGSSQVTGNLAVTSVSASVFVGGYLVPEAKFTVLSSKPMTFWPNTTYELVRMTTGGGVLIGRNGETNDYGNRLDVSGSVRFTGNTTITGSLIVTNGFTGSIASTNGVVSGSSQLTASYDTRYTLSGSVVSGTTPAGTISGSSQLTSSFDGRYTQTGSFNTLTASFNSFTASAQSVTTGSNSFNGTQTITGSLIITTGSFVASQILANTASLYLTSGSNLYVQNDGVVEITGSLNVSGTSTLKGAVNIGTGSGFEGGEIQLAYAQSGNTSLVGSAIAFDVYQDKIRMFEGGGTNRGAYLNVASQSAGVGSEIVTSPNVSTIQTITSASYAALTPVSGTLYIIIG